MVDCNALELRFIALLLFMSFIGYLFATLLAFCSLWVFRKKFTGISFLNFILILTILLNLFGWQLGHGSTLDCDLIELRQALTATLLAGVIVLGGVFFKLRRLRNNKPILPKTVLILVGILIFVNTTGWIYALRIRKVMPTQNCDGTWESKSCLEKLAAGEG